jgi:hypothetical protein
MSRGRGEDDTPIRVGGQMTAKGDFKKIRRRAEDQG